MVDGDDQLNDNPLPFADNNAMMVGIYILELAIFEKSQQALICKSGNINPICGEHESVYHGAEGDTRDHVLSRT